MMAEQDGKVSTTLELVVIILWIGLLVGVSFLATPAKFLAPSLSLAVALDVGRQTFSVFNKVEWFVAAALLAVVLAGRRGPLSIVVALLAAVLVVAETLWLLPMLDFRVGQIIAGQQPAASNLHVLYIAVEIGKLAVLCIAAAATAWRLSR